MPFVKKELNGGKVDPNINIAGRTPSTEKPTKRSIRDRELMQLLRKIKPHLTDSIMTAANIMKNEKANEQNRLKAAVILLNAYKELVDDVYNGVDAEEEGEEIQKTNPAVFSLKVIGGDE